MKKVLLLFVAFTALTFASCSKDDNNKAPDSLSGTIWDLESPKSFTEKDDDGKSHTYEIDGTIYFLNSTDYKQETSEKEDGGLMDTDTVEGKYTYSNGIVVFKGIYGLLEGEGEIKDNKLVIIIIKNHLNILDLPDGKPTKFVYKKR